MLNFNVILFHAFIQYLLSYFHIACQPTIAKFFPPL